MKNQRPHENLQVWERSVQFVTEVYRLSGDFPDTERYGLTSQLRRAAVSVPTNIAEGASRRPRKEYIQFLYVSRGSLSEIETLLVISQELNLVKPEKYRDFRSKTELIGRLLTGLINALKRK